MYDKSITQDMQGFWVNERHYDHVTTHGPMNFDEARLKYDSLPPDDGEDTYDGHLVYDRVHTIGPRIRTIDDLVRNALKEATQC